MVKKIGKRQRKSKAMDKFQLVEVNNLSQREMAMQVKNVISLGKQKGKNISRKEAEELINQNLEIPTYINNKYQVHVHKSQPEDNKIGFHIDGKVASESMGITHLSIRTHDRSPISDWRDMQTIKNELVGKEYEAVQLHPAESRLIDTVNQYHLWVLEKPKGNGGYFPIGWHDRLVDYNRKSGGAKQRGKE